MNRIYLFSLLMWAGLTSSAFAADISGLESDLSIYNKEFVGNKSGVYKNDGRIFFIADQLCLKEKKYAGTAESKAATAKVMVLMAEYALAKGGGIARKDIGVNGALGDDVFQLYQQRNLAGVRAVSASGRRVIDTDTGNCSRRVVYVLPEDAFEHLSENVKSLPDMDELKSYLFKKAQSDENYNRLAAYFSSLNLPEIELAFSSKSAGDEILRYPSSINWYKDGANLAKAMTKCQTPESTHLDTLDKYIYDMTKAVYCGKPIELDNAGLEYAKTIDRSTGQFSSELAVGDNQGVVQLVLNNYGIVVFSATESRAHIEKLNNQAQGLFSKGTDAPGIIRLYSQSLNVNPLQPAIWVQLGSVMKAYGYNGAASAIYQQALLQNPEDIDIWINLAQALIANGQNERGQEILAASISLSTIFPISKWGIEQLKKLDQ